MSGIVLDIASKPAARASTLDEDAAEALAYAVLDLLDAHLAEHLASDAELSVWESLDDVIEVDCEDAVAFIFAEHWARGAACGYHWYEHALAARWTEVTALFAAHGQRVTAKPPNVEKLYGPQRGGYIFGVAAGDVVAVHATGEVLVPRAAEEDAVLAVDDSALDPAMRELVAELYATGLCACSLCVTARPRSFKAKPLRRRVEPPAPYVLALEAARRGDLAGLERVVAGGGYVDLERCMAEGVTSPDVRTVSHLIARGVRVTPEVAANAARLNVVAALELLHAHGVDLTALDNMGRSPLANACTHGGVDAVRYLLSLGVDVEAVDRYHGNTALLWAFVDDSENAEHVVAALLAAGANTKVRDGRGWGIDEHLEAISDPARKAALARALGR